MRVAVEVIGVTTIISTILQHVLVGWSNRKNRIVGSAIIAGSLVFFSSLWSNNNEPYRMPYHTGEIVITVLIIIVYVRLLDNTYV
jgi:hypothetical protein